MPVARDKHIDQIMNATTKNTEAHSNIATRKITKRCGRCDGSGLYYLTASSTGPDPRDA